MSYNTEEFERECGHIIKMYGKQWDIKPNVLKGCLWWKDAMEKAFWKGKEREKERIIEILKRTPNLEDNYNILMNAICVDCVTEGENE